ncbi:hypothetical protein EKD04_023710 [Chloroflexales bacterium ZM16-3]|nr:hypothetical protein [Chloroflexales bacterium ZM16-3]
MRNENRCLPAQREEDGVFAVVQAVVEPQVPAAPPAASEAAGAGAAGAEGEE